ncbi:MAG: putative sulfate exporter family transporter, partial [Candidatus Kapaibacteriota bacterium]
VSKETKTLPGVGSISTNQANVFRTLFFVLTFFTIGLVSNFRKLWEEGIGKLAAIYVLALFGFIIWVALLISWLFFHNVLPPTISS